MKRSLLSIVILWIATSSFSTNTWNGTEKDSTHCNSVVTITAKELKETNRIFAEHYKLLQENNLLWNQACNYENEVILLQHIDSTRCLQISEYQEQNSNLATQVNNLKTKLSKKKKQLAIWKIGGFSITAVAVLLLLF